MEITSETLLTQCRIGQLLYSYVEAIDNQDFKTWYGLFTKDGVYSAITFENLNDKGLTQFTDRGQNDLKERAAFWMGMWQTSRAKLTHITANTLFKSLSADEAELVSKFTSYRTNEDGISGLYAVGEYRDRVVQQEGEWLFASRLVVLDCWTMPSSFTDPF